MDNMQDIELPINQEEQNIQLFEAQQYERQMEQNSQRMIALQDNVAATGNIPEEIKPVKNPVSPYMIFVGSWKQKHPEQKFSLSGLGQIWKAMTLAEKEPFQTEYQARRKLYEEYVTVMQLQNPNMGVKESAGKFLIPLHRIKSILNQDSFFSAKSQAIPAMAKAVQYFAEYMLEEVKRMSEGKNRIDHGLLYDCINNQRSFSFLECLIEEHNRDGSQVKEKKNRPEIRLELEGSQKKVNRANTSNQNKVIPQSSNVKKTGQGQMSLDSFFAKQR